MPEYKVTITRVYVIEAKTEDQAIKEALQVFDEDSGYDEVSVEQADGS